MQTPALRNATAIRTLFTFALAVAGCAQGAGDLGAFEMPQAPHDGGDGDAETDGGTGDAPGGSTGDGAGATGGSTTGGPAPVCGDGIVEGDEACDDGNLDDGDGCEADCTLTPACGDGQYSPGEICHTVEYTPDVGGSAAGVVIADLDTDGDLDLVASMPAGDRILRVLFEQGAPDDEAEFLTIPEPGLLQALDTDSDGDPDLLVEAPNGPYVDTARLANNGNGSFSSGQNVLFGGLYASAFGNFDNDDKLDGLIVGPSPDFPNVTYTYSDLEMGPNNPLGIWVWDPETPSAVHAEDIDGDGIDDLVAVLPMSSELQLKMIDANGSPATTIPLAQIPVTDRIFVGDVSGDGTPDVVSLFLNEPKVMVLALAPTPDVDSIAYVETPDLLMDVAAGDFDGDGLIDLVAASQTQELLFLRAKAPMEWELAHTIVLGDVPSQIAVGDLNEDGRDDVAVALAGFGEVRVALSQP